ncbi:MAG: RluA family pseudouridine synthase [Planctomycetota bacterium]
MEETDSSTESVHDLVVDEEANGVRLDQWLHARFPDLSRSALKRLINDGRVRIDDATPKPSTSLRTGSKVVVRIPPPPPPMPIPENVSLDILHEDDALLVVSKPAGMVVHPSPGTSARGTLVNALLGWTEDLSSEGGEFRPGIVHRLDRETSGVLLVARTDRSHRKLAEQFKERTVHKEYVAFVHGVPTEPEGIIDQPLGRSPTQRQRMAIRHDDQGKPATTSWKVEHDLGSHSWLRMFPKTGRTHQIRVHLKSIQLPIVCDATYGREKKITASELHGKTVKQGELPLLERHALHAHRIRFQHPETGAWTEFEAPLHADMQAVWDATVTTQ